MEDNITFISDVTKLKKSKLIIISLIILILLVGGFILYKNIFKKSETYTVVNGYVENITDSQGIVIKQEQIVDLNNSNTIIPLTEQGKRVRKTESVAIYKDSKYDEYIQKISDMDKQIETLVKDLPEIYSNDISYIENQIELIGNQAKNTTSYIKMQEYKTKIDELSNQKVTLLGELSPSGSKIRELIEKRTEVEENYRNSSDNVKSPMSGCVTYKLDKMENLSDISKVFNYSANDINDLYEKYKQNPSNDFGIKIVNNFLAYIIVKVKNNDNIKVGNSYSIIFNDIVGMKETVVLNKVVNIDDQNQYCIFEINNGIEELLDSRIENVEIVWTRKTGKVIPLDSIKLNENSNIGYVTVIKNGDYIQIPVKVIISNDNMAVVDNLTDEDKNSNNIQNNNNLEIFDQVVIKE